MKQSKIPAALLAATLLLSLAACGQDQGDTEPTPTADTVQIGLLLPGQEEDPYDQNHIQGLQAACQALGIDYDTQVLVRSNVPEDDTCADTIQELTEAGCQILFSAASGHETALIEAAVSHPDLPVCQAGGSQGNQDALDNTHTHYAQVYQAWYLAGIAAGLKSLETGNNNVGYVAAFGRQYAETSSGINGFALGVQAVNPDATVYVKELGAWADEVNEGAFAEELIQSFNCGVISQHCDSAQPQIAAQDLGVFGCGYNSDMTADAPQAHLTAAIWNWNVYYHTAIEAAMTCGGAENFVTAMGGPAYYGGLAEGFVDVSPLNEATVAPGTAEAIEAVRELIVSGEWDVFSGTKLHITVNDDGTVTVDQEDADLLCDGYEYDTTSGTLVERDPVIVAAGGESVEDSVITGSMNYFVAGVEDAN